MSESDKHITVLLEQAVSQLCCDPDAQYVDATFGRGGHSRAILSRLDAKGRLLVIDRDPDAINVARQLQREDSRLQVVQGGFGDLVSIAQAEGVQGQVAGVLFDLGVSSPQLDDPRRGFSFMRDGPLDMRMDPDHGQSAADWLNQAQEQEIAEVLFRYGEERHSRRMARAIVRERQQSPIVNTARLAEIIKQANPAWERDRHPATRAFQGIRIFINSELDQLSQALEQALEVLRIGGRLVVISFHSLEDRIVKKFIAMQTKGDRYPRDLPIPAAMLQPRLRSIGKPVRPKPDEVAANPRARSAVMRVAEKIA